MKESTTKLLSEIVIFSFLLLFVGLLVYSLISSSIQDNKEDDFCKIVYPAKINRQSSIFRDYDGSTLNIEKGYINCCRTIIVNHDYIKECKIFKYNK